MSIGEIMSMAANMYAAQVIRSSLRPAMQRRKKEAPRLLLGCGFDILKQIPGALMGTAGCSGDRKSVV